MDQGIKEMLEHIGYHHYNVAATNGDVVVQNYVADDAQLTLHYVHKTCGHQDHANIDSLTKLQLGHL